MFSWLGRSAKNARKNRGKIGEKRGAGKRNEVLSVLYFAAPFLRTAPKLTGGLEETGRRAEEESKTSNLVPRVRILGTRSEDHLEKKDKQGGVEDQKGTKERRALV